jgi:hypothetical protein
MSKDIYHKVIEELQEELVVNSTSMSPYSKNILSSLIKNKAEEYKLHKIQPTEEDLKKDINTLLETVVSTIIKSREYKDKLYKKSYDKLKALGDESKSYGDLFSEIYDDEEYLCDIFIRLIEEEEGVVITSAKQLQELTGIEEIKGYWDADKGEVIPYKDKTISTKKEAQEEAKKQIEQTFIQGMYNRYFTTIEDMLDAGAKYKDILLLSPKDFNLPDQWSGTLAKNKEEVILWAIGFTYQINEPSSLMMLPSLRTVAEEIEAPYSILMDCYKLFHGDKNKKEEVKDKIKAIGQKVRTKFLDFIKSKGKKWRRDWLLEDEPELYSGALEDVKEDYVISITQVALKDITGREAKCGAEIENDIRQYFKDELQEVTNLIQKK